MNWNIGQEVIWVGANGREKGDPCKITGIRLLGCCDKVMLETTDSEINYTPKAPLCVCNKGVPSFGPQGKYRNGECFRPLISDSCIAELVKEQVLSTQ